MTNKSDAEICGYILLVIIIIILIVISAIFWYVSVPIFILIIYIYYRTKNKFPKTVYKAKEKERVYLKNTYGKGTKGIKTKELDVWLENGKEVQTTVNKKTKIGLIIQNFSKNSVFSIQLALIGPKEVKIITQKTYISILLADEEKKVNFKIISEQTGIFTLTAIIFKQSKETERKSLTLHVETESFENLIKKSSVLIKKTKKLLMKKSYTLSVDSWSEAISYYNMALAKVPIGGEKELKILRENIYNSYIDFISKNCLIVKDYSLIIQDNKIITKPILGLNAFLSYWVENKGDNIND